MFYMVNLLFVLNVVGFCFNYSGFLKSLMMIEFIVLSLMVAMLVSHLGGFVYLIYLLVFAVCEGIVGLLVMLSTYRLYDSFMYSLVDFIY